MRFLDNRRDIAAPLPDILVTLAGHLLVRSTDAHLPPGQVEQWIKVSDYDQVTGSIIHFQLNYEPAWLNDEFRDAWRAKYGDTLRSELLEHIAWKRFAWGVWVESN
jgi:hypothetical protein